MAQLLVHCTHGREDPERATLAFVVGNVAASADQDVVVLLKDVDGREWALAGCLILKPTAAGLSVERPLQIQEHVKRVGISSDHDAPIWGRP